MSKLPTLQLKHVKPLTDNQERIFQEFQSGQQLFIHGSAGTGKTYVSLYLALREIFERSVCDTGIHKIVIVRSAVPTREVGFLPGNLQEKLEVYEQPYISIVDDLFGQAGMYDVLRKKEYIEFMSTSYVRGLTLDSAVVIVEECQNLNFGELDSIITRLGENSRVIFCGDFFQTDLTREKERNGLKTFFEILARLSEFSRIELTEDDIVRSATVKRFIVEKNRYFEESYGRKLEPVTA